MAVLPKDVVDFLVAQGIAGGATGWTAIASYLPPDPDQVLVVYETGGADPHSIPTGSTQVEYDEPNFQVRGRAAAFDYNTLRAKMRDVYKALHDSQLGNSVNHVFVRATQGGPFSLGLDDSNRPGLTWNFRAYRRRDADA